MPQPASREPIHVLADWWRAMGVEVDAAHIETLLAAADKAAAPVQQTIAPPARAAAPSRPQRAVARSHADWVAAAAAAAAAAADLDALAAAIRAFEGSPLRAGCEQAVVSDGRGGASLMVIGEGPGAEEDRQGKPFVGRAGQLLDKMLAAIGRRRAENVFISNVNFWRPPANRNPEPAELEVCRPFVDRMIELARPKLIVAAGGVPAAALLARTDGIMKLRGQEYPFRTRSGFEVPLIPMLHPAYLLRRPQDKSRAWRDLLFIEARLEALGG